MGDSKLGRIMLFNRRRHKGTLPKDVLASALRNNGVRHHLLVLLFDI